MAIVKEYHIGNTEILIDDEAYKDNTPEDNQKIVDRISEIYTRSICSKINSRSKCE